MAILGWIVCMNLAYLGLRFGLPTWLIVLDGVMGMVYGCAVVVTVIRAWEGMVR